MTRAPGPRSAERPTAERPTAERGAAERGPGGWVPVPSGRAFRVVSPPANARVTPDLAHELRRVLERFAREAGFGTGRPVEIHFEPGVVGHHKVGRAADIYAVGGVGLEEWKRRWDRARDPANLGWRLYRALARHGAWARPRGYPVQLFGPWTREEGPWRRISDRLLYAHRDHIHVAK